MRAHAHAFAPFEWISTIWKCVTVIETLFWKLKKKPFNSNKKYHVALPAENKYTFLLSQCSHTTNAIFCAELSNGIDVCPFSSFYVLNSFIAQAIDIVVPIGSSTRIEHKTSRNTNSSNPFDTLTLFWETFSSKIYLPAAKLSLYFMETFAWNHSNASRGYNLKVLNVFIINKYLTECGICWLIIWIFSELTPVDIMKQARAFGARTKQP